MWVGGRGNGRQRVDTLADISQVVPTSGSSRMFILLPSNTTATTGTGHADTILSTLLPSPSPSR